METGQKQGEETGRGKAAVVGNMIEAGVDVIAKA